MSLGLSQQVGTQISHLHQNQNQTTATNNSHNILRLGSATKFEHLIPPLNNQSSLQSMPSSAFFNMSDTTNQAFEEQHQSHQQGAFTSKQLHGLMQLPDLQGNNNNNTTTNNNNPNNHPASVAAPNSNLFNLSFFPNNSSIPDHQFNQGTTLYNTNNNNNNNPLSSDDQVGFFGNSILQQHAHQNMSPHMSATALLQKAAQIGSSTTATKGSSSLIRGMYNSSSTTSMENDQQNHGIGHHNNLHGLMNSIANIGNTISIFDNVQGNESNNDLGRFHHNLGSDKLTLDFLGVGGMVKNMSTGGFSQREQQQQQRVVAMSTMSSLDPHHDDLKPPQSSQHFGSSTMQ